MNSCKINCTINEQCKKVCGPKELICKKQKIDYKSEHEKKYLRYLKKLSKVHPFIDCTSPEIYFSIMYFKFINLKSDLKRWDELNKENLSNMYKINKTYRKAFPGKIDVFSKKDEINVRKYKARKKKFNEIEKENKKMFKRLANVTPVIQNIKSLNEDYKRMEKISELHHKLRPIQTTSYENCLKKEKILKLIKNRPQVYLDFTTENGVELGRLVIVLFIDIVPRTVLNFIHLCENWNFFKKKSKTSKFSCFYYANSPVHRIFKGLFMEAGDITIGDGNGGKAADGSNEIPAENYLVDHSYKGTLSMIPTQSGNVNSLFTISFRPIEAFNGKRVAFGRVVQGQNKVLKAIDLYGSDNGKTDVAIFISNCGLLNCP